MNSSSFKHLLTQGYGKKKATRASTFLPFETFLFALEMVATTMRRNRLPAQGTDRTRKRTVRGHGKADCDGVVNPAPSLFRSAGKREVAFLTSLTTNTEVELLYYQLKVLRTQLKKRRLCVEDSRLVNAELARNFIQNRPAQKNAFGGHGDDNVLERAE